MRFKEVLSRLTGLSTPIFGAQWNPPESEVTIARRVLAYLEDRRVLYNPDSLEVPAHCVDSVIQIRHFLTSEIATLPEKSTLSASLRAMRAACRKFLDTLHERQPQIVDAAWRPGHWASWHFNAALGELRGVFGIHVAQIAAQHGLDVEKELASILPVEDENDDTGNVPRRRPWRT